MRVHQKDGANGGVAQGAVRLQRRETSNLLQDVGRRIEQHPVLPVGACGDGRLGASRELGVAAANPAAIGAVAVPLRKATASGRAQDMDFHVMGLKGALGERFSKATRRAYQTGWQISNFCDQRLEMYIVISKPRRRSVAAGFSHFIRSLLQFTPAKRGKRTGRASVSTGPSIGAGLDGWHRQIMDLHLMIFMSFTNRGGTLACVRG